MSYDLIKIKQVSLQTILPAIGYWHVEVHIDPSFILAICQEKKHIRTSKWFAIIPLPLILIICPSLKYKIKMLTVEGLGTDHPTCLTWGE